MNQHKLEAMSDCELNVLMNNVNKARPFNGPPVINFLSAAVMPIALDNRIFFRLVARKNDLYIASRGATHICSKSPYRAICIVYLLMQGDKS